MRFSLILVAILGFYSTGSYTQTSDNFASDNFTVLSWNICFECMTHNSKGTAGRLGAKCVWNSSKTRTICAANISEQIDDAIDETNDEGYDFILLQESLNSNTLNSSEIEKMKRVPFRSGMVTLYNHYKYILLKEIQGTFESGRPFQITIYYNEQSQVGIIVVNLHAPHYKGNIGRNLAHGLSKGLKNALSGKSSSRSIGRHRSKKVETMPSLDELKAYRIVIGGDFNDFKGTMWKSQKQGDPFRPFLDAGLDTAVYFPNEPPRTCCSTEVPFKKGITGYGDYILYSEGAHGASLSLPQNYDRYEPKSDHLPVILTVSPAY